MVGGTTEHRHLSMLTGSTPFHRKCPSHRKSILCGVASGGAAQMLASPTDLVKVRLQMVGESWKD